MFGLTKYGAGIGLHRILRFCRQEAIDLDAISARSIVVTGSKGKGSTARFIYQAVRAAYPEVGCFISPHLFDVSERYEFAGRRIEAELFGAYQRKVLSFAESLAGEGDALGAFEALFLIALKWFDTVKPRCIVWEAGIGGRYDPVRALRARFSALTSVELEHTELLGASLELIAYDKLDALRPGGRAFVSPAVPEALRERLAAFGRVAEKTISFASDAARIEALSVSKEATSYRLIESDGAAHDVTIPLIGRHQAHNSLIALLVAKAFLRETQGNVPTAALVGALRDTRWPGRLERLSQAPDVWIDVGHTPESVRAVCDEFLRLYDRAETILVFGVSHNKAVREIVAIIEARFDAILLTRAGKNGVDVATLKAAFGDPAGIIDSLDDIGEAVARVRTLAASGKAALVVGGLFLAAEFAHAWRGGDPKKLQFF